MPISDRVAHSDRHGWLRQPVNGRAPAEASLPVVPASDATPPAERWPADAPAKVPATPPLPRVGCDAASSLIGRIAGATLAAGAATGVGEVRLGVGISCPQRQSDIRRPKTRQGNAQPRSYERASPWRSRFLLGVALRHRRTFGHECLLRASSSRSSRAARRSLASSRPRPPLPLPSNRRNSGGCPSGRSSPCVLRRQVLVGSRSDSGAAFAGFAFARSS